MRGIMQARLTYQYLRSYLKKRPFIVSMSTFPGFGQYGGHFQQMVSSSWESLQQTVPNMFNFQIFGIPFFGTTICGYKNDTSTDLCSRWHQLGVFMPLSMNINARSSIPQEPYSLGTMLKTSSSKSIRLKYALLLYHYYNFYNITKSGGTYITPMCFAFKPTEKVADYFYQMQDQFMFGEAFLVAPVLEKSQSVKRIYFPYGAQFFDYWTGKKIEGNDTWLEIKVKRETIPL